MRSPDSALLHVATAACRPDAQNVLGVNVKTALLIPHEVPSKLHSQHSRHTNQVLCRSRKSVLLLSALRNQTHLRTEEAEDQTPKTCITKPCCLYKSLFEPEMHALTSLSRISNHERYRCCSLWWPGWPRASSKASSSRTPETAIQNLILISNQQWHCFQVEKSVSHCAQT